MLYFVYCNWLEEGGGEEGVGRYIIRLFHVLYLGIIFCWHRTHKRLFSPSDVSTKPESFPDNTILTYIEDDELLEDNSDSLEGEEDDPEFDPDLFLWKKSSIANNEPDFSSGTIRYWGNWLRLAIVFLTFPLEKYRLIDW